MGYLEVLIAFLIVICTYVPLLFTLPIPYKGISVTLSFVIYRAYRYPHDQSRQLAHTYHPQDQACKKWITGGSFVGDPTLIAQVPAVWVALQLVLLKMHALRFGATPMVASLLRREIPMSANKWLGYRWRGLGVMTLWFSSSENTPKYYKLILDNHNPQYPSVSPNCHDPVLHLSPYCYSS